MLFKNYTIYENKLSEQLSDDNPYKEKLRKMETPVEKHFVYTWLVWGLIVYCWVFFIVLFYNQLNISMLYNLKLTVSLGNLIFVTICICICYKKDYIIGVNPKYRRNMCVIFIFSAIFSILLSSLDSKTANWKEICQALVFFYGVTPKSYLALSFIANLSLGIALSYCNNIYEVYRGFYSVHKTYKEYKTEKVLIDRSVNFLFLVILAFFPLIYIAFNPAQDSFGEKIKSVALFAFVGFTPICTTIFWGKKYYSLYQRSLKFFK